MNATAAPVVFHPDLNAAPTDAAIPFAQPAVESVPGTPATTANHGQPPPTAAGETSAETPFEIQANADRQAAWDLALAPEFAGLELQPWSMERHRLALQLMEADVPGFDLDSLKRIHDRLTDWARGHAMPEVPPLGSVIDLRLYLPAAEKVLYLAAHLPEQFLHLRPRLAQFLSSIADWGAQHISPDQAETACLTALRILTQHEKMLVLHQPTRKSGKPGLGN